MSPEQRAEVKARLLRILAGYADIAAARLRLAAQAVEANESFRRFAAAVQAGYDRDVAEHPDLAETNVRLDALYEPPGVPCGDELWEGE